MAMASYGVAARNVKSSRMVMARVARGRAFLTDPVGRSLL